MRLSHELTTIRTGRINSRKKSSPEFEQYLRASPLIALDVGARLTRADGVVDNTFLDPLINNNPDFFSVIFCEADKTEAAVLKSFGLDVIPVALGRTKRIGKLFVTADPGCSSFYSPNSEIIQFYDGKAGLERFDIVDELEVTIDTLSNQLQELGKKHLDYLKIDTQGSELDVLNGLGDFRPFLIKTEVSAIPLYRDQPLCFEIEAFLGSLGYLKFHESFRPFLAFGDQNPDVHEKIHTSTPLPLHGDAWFCPNLGTQEGRSIALRDVGKFDAAMRLVGLDGYVKSLL